MTFIIGLYFIPSAALTLCTGRRRRTLMVDPVSGAELDLADKILPSKATERSGTYPLYWPLIPGLTNMQLIRLQSLSSLLASIPGLTNIQLIRLQSLYCLWPLILGLTLIRVVRLQSPCSLSVLKNIRLIRLQS